MFEWSLWVYTYSLMLNLDIDECATNNSECSQVCINIEGSYSCTGYDLGPDNHTYNGMSTIHVNSVK